MTTTTNTNTDTTNLPTQYDPKTTESKWQKYWEDNLVFKANPNLDGESYSIAIPPPNVTGSLHMGHAFEASLIDTLVRYNRMLGKNTLCLPGTDHASIAVHTVIEKQLKAEGKTRFDLGREEFLQRAWQWRHQSGDTIVNQLKRLGLSADWTRERFTLDDNLCQAVKKAFVTLYEEGLIYRGKYLVNWCPESQSAVSDLEVENKEVDGHLWHFRYPLTNGEGFLEVATTRPETMLGDTAVAVNPNDDRYKSFIGKTLTLPIMNREIPIIADELVDSEFGTGCVKVTPAHDPNDFEMGKRHQLPFINILNKDGSLNENGGEFAGQDRFIARKNVVKRLEEEGVLVKIEDYRHSVPYSDRGKVPVEPFISTQWFVKIEPLAKKALTELDENNSPKFVPERWHKVYRDWLVKLKDWCISRQLWWGHQIPAWYVISETNNEITDNTPFIVAYDEEEAQGKAIAKYGENVKLEQETDILDTWFSSGLWPFSTLGWPDETKELETYFPTTNLVTGFDIIFFWVARMTMMSGHFTNEMPFKDVYIHGLVRDENGKKMSKTAGNGIDPLLLIDKYGTDALRYTLIKEVAGAGQDITLQYDREKDESPSVEASRNFANKLWNAARFVMMNLDGKSPDHLGTPNLQLLEECDRWILSRFNQVVKQSRDYLDNYGLGEAAKGIYEFIWGDFCDWYIELVKSRLRKDSDSSSRLVAQQTLGYVLEGILKLLHPFMPHVTEEIWHTLTQKEDLSLALQPYPKVDELLKPSLNEMVFDLSSKIKGDTGNKDKKETEQPSLWQKSLGILLGFIDQYSKWIIPSVFVVITFIAAVIAIRVISTVFITIHQIPLVSPTFRLIGLGYSVWFFFRYLLLGKNRGELREIIDNIKDNTFGKSDKKSNISENSNQKHLISNKDTQVSKSKEIKSLIDTKLEEEFQLIIGAIYTIRNLRASVNMKPGIKIPVILQSENQEERTILEKGRAYIQDLPKVEKLTITPTLKEKLKGAIAGVVGTVQVLIPLQGVVDIDVLRAKLEKNLAKVEAEVNSLSNRLNNQKFISKAPEEVIQAAKDSLAEAQTQAQILRDRLELLN